MADTPEISSITLPSGTTYNIKDATARNTISQLTNATRWLGTTTTQLSDGSETAIVSIGGASTTAVAGDIVGYDDKEFIFNGTKWQEFGSTGSLKALAFKDSASGSFTPSGSVSTPSFTGSSGSVSVSGTPAGSISVGTGTANYTPGGTIGTPEISVTLTTDTKYVATSSSGGGSVTAGSAASCTLPTLTTSVANETLTISWAAGSFTANTPTEVTLPNFSSATLATGVQSASSSTPSFTGAGVELVFTGESTTSTGSFTPSGSVSTPSFTGTAGTVTVS